MDNDPEEEFRARSRAVSTERVAIAVAAGSQHENMTVSAEPEDPDSGAIEDRRYFIDVDETVHTDGGFITGVCRRRYELTLSPVETS